MREASAPIMQTGCTPGGQFPEKTVDQQRGGQQREEGKVHFNPILL